MSKKPLDNMNDTYLMIWMKDPTIIDRDENLTTKYRNPNSYIKYLTRKELVEMWDSGKLDDFEFIGHLEFDFNLWNVNFADGKIPAVLIPSPEAIIPTETKTVTTTELII